MRRPGDDEEGELEQPDDDRDPLDAPVGAGGDDREQRDRGERQGQPARQAVEFADARHAGEFGDQRADHRRRQAQPSTGTPIPTPKRSRISSPWPRPVKRPSRTVNSCTM